LTPKILSDPTHKITRHILYIYTMESFLYKELNNSSRKKEPNRIKYYGPMAAVLGYIVQYANKR